MKQSFACAVIWVLLASPLEAGQRRITLTRESTPAGIVLGTASEITFSDQTLGCILLVVEKIRAIRGSRAFDLTIDVSKADANQANYFEIDRDALTSGQEYDTVWTLETIRVTTGLLQYQELTRRGRRYIKVSPGIGKDAELLQISKHSSLSRAETR